ncbi:MAG TPA: Bax inhibitor-1/YccA family protein [Chitinophagaceae bacterium]|nr:Bax inhibitor-1/YccA family protein [Chitinophagaceae bacterium]
MAIFKSGNPALNEKTFQQSVVVNQAEVMTERGTLNKFFLLFLLVMATASITWNAFSQGKDVTSWMWIGVLGGLVTAIVLMFKPMWASILAPVYALFEGAFIGGISAVYDFAFKGAATGATGGIIMQAVGLTFAVVIAMFALYRFRIIKATETFKSVIITATMGIAIFYVLAMVLRMFSIDMPLIHSSGTLGIVFSLVVVGIAALNLILDFDRIEQGAAMGAPKYMEWYGAFGLLVTIVWLYLEILRLLAKLNSRN